MELHGHRPPREVAQHAPPRLLAAKLKGDEGHLQVVGGGAAAQRALHIHAAGQGGAAQLLDGGAPACGPGATGSAREQERRPRRRRQAASRRGRPREAQVDAVRISCVWGTAQLLARSAALHDTQGQHGEACLASR